MALTLNITNYPFRDKLMNRQVRVATMTGPASYATGGVAIDNLGDFGWADTQFIKVNIGDGTSIRIGTLARGTQKIQFWVPNTNVEVANGVDLSTFSGQLLALGQ